MHGSALAHASGFTNGPLLAGKVDVWAAAGAAVVLLVVAAFVGARYEAGAARIATAASIAIGIAVTWGWHIDPLIAGGLFLAAWAYATGTARLWTEAGRGAGISVKYAALYGTGLALLIVALLSPVDTFGEELFSMHMVQHELLMLVVAPLLVAGRPLAAFIWAFPAGMRKRVGRLVKSPVVSLPWRALTRPLPAWSIHAAILWGWHAPALFEASLASDAVHTLQHISFLLSALLFWASIIGPGALRDGEAALYLLASTIHTGMLGALLTFSPRAWYPTYAGRTEAFELTLLEDQQLGGLIMWVPAGFVFILAGLAFAARAIAPRATLPQAGRSP